jgi:hypothetical protein
MFLAAANLVSTSKRQSLASLYLLSSLSRFSTSFLLSVYFLGYLPHSSVYTALCPLLPAYGRVFGSAIRHLHNAM